MRRVRHPGPGLGPRSSAGLLILWCYGMWWAHRATRLGLTAVPRIEWLDDYGARRNAAGNASRHSCFRIQQSTFWNSPVPICCIMADRIDCSCSGVGHFQNLQCLPHIFSFRYAMLWWLLQSTTAESESFDIGTYKSHYTASFRQHWNRLHRQWSQSSSAHGNCLKRAWPYWKAC